MLQTIHEYAYERLQESDEADELRRRHAEYFAELAEAAEGELAGARQEAWLERLAAEHDNLRGAVTWALAAAPELALRLTAALGPFWDRRGHLHEGGHLLRAALDLHGEVGLPRARAQRAFAWIALRQGQPDAAEAAAREALRSFRAAADSEGVARSLAILSFVAAEKDDIASARSLGEEARLLFRELGNDHGYEVATSNLAYYSLRAADYARARELATESLSLQRVLENTIGIAVSLLNLAGASIRLGEHDRARGEIAEALELAEGLALPGLAADCLCVLAAVALAADDASRAASFLGRAEALYRRAGAAPEAFERETRQAAILTARRLLSEAAFDEQYAAGETLETSAAVAYARGETAITPAQ